MLTDAMLVPAAKYQCPMAFFDKSVEISMGFVSCKSCAREQLQCHYNNTGNLLLCKNSNIRTI